MGTSNSAHCARSEVKYVHGLCRTAYRLVLVRKQFSGMASAYTPAVRPWSSASPKTEVPSMGWDDGSPSSWTPNVEPPAMAR